MSSTRSTRDAAAMKIGREGNVTLSYPLLTKSNYSLWAFKIRVNLQAQGVWEAVMFEDVDERMDRMALAAIYQALPEDVLLLVAEKDSAKLAWETLKTMHVGVERVNENGESVDDFAMKLTSNLTGIRSLGETVEEISVVKKFLRALPQTYIQIVTAIEQFGDLKNMIVKEIKNGEAGFSSRSSSRSGNGGDNRGRGKGQGKVKGEVVQEAHLDKKVPNPAKTRAQ
ncbi:uncharacterized protein LOC124934729 [Impatiens glandulifera]|uniref:uncharacterized protein LOC124934729 n=1 Tax=Impatiens glandulifera TaxID=253017 RepID=UPI001FB176E5|nr:uncharacterized protein LOC124934729 [Impatiens glandulifera]